MTLIVVEGVDASGKSTLLENLRAVPGYFVLMRHSCRPLKTHDVTSFLRLAEMPMILPRVIDRHPLISEPIYGPLLRGRDLTEGMFTPDQILRRIQKTVNRIIYCRPPKELVLANLVKRPQLAGVIEQIDSLYERYDTKMEALADVTKVIPYDWSFDQSVDLQQMFFGGVK